MNKIPHRRPAYTDQEIRWLNTIVALFISHKVKLSYSQEPEGRNALILKYENHMIDLQIEDFDVSNVPNACKRTLQGKGLTELIDVIFTQLNRTEEYGTSNLDCHQRHPAIASCASAGGYLEWPIADISIAIIRKALSRKIPGLRLNNYKPKNIISCDVDSPYAFYLSNFQTFLRKLGGDLTKRGSPHDFRKTWNNYWRSRRSDYSADPYNTFDWMMDVNEREGNRMVFYFLVDKTSHRYDGYYSINEPRIRRLLRRVYERGHEIGLHPSYNTSRDPNQLKLEAKRLRQVLLQEKIRQEGIGSRQHYLRWCTPETARHLDSAGLLHDSTLGYADHIGFRCGTSHEFPMLDIDRQQILKIFQRPLIVMDQTIFSPNYMGMDRSDYTLEYVTLVKRRCFQYGGNFSLLWHNSSLNTDTEKQFYLELIKA